MSRALCRKPGCGAEEIWSSRRERGGIPGVGTGSRGGKGDGGVQVQEPLAEGDSPGRWQELRD